MHVCLMSDTFKLITPLFKPYSLIFSEKITLIFPLMTNEYQRSCNPLFVLFPWEKRPNMDENHHLEGIRACGRREEGIGGVAKSPKHKVESGTSAHARTSACTK